MQKRTGVSIFVSDDVLCKQDQDKDQDLLLDAENARQKIYEIFDMFSRVEGNWVFSQCECLLMQVDFLLSLYTEESYNVNYTTRRIK